MAARSVFKSLMVAATAGTVAFTAIKYTNVTPTFSPVMHAAAVPAKPVVASKPVVAAPAVTKSTIPPEGLVGTNYERTFIAIKPDGIQRGLIAKIIARFEEKGFQLVAVKFLTPTEDIAKSHYEDLSNKPFFPTLVKFFSSGPVLALVWQGKGVITTGRKLLGETDPAKSLPGSIRGDYSIDIGRNIIHGSDSPDGAKHEINFWFQPQELVNWTPTQNQHVYEKP